MRLYYFLLLVLVWCFGFAYILNLPGNISFQSDEVSYWRAAGRMYSDFRPGESRPLLIALIHGFPMLFGISSMHHVAAWVVGLNLILWLLTQILVFKMVQEHTGKKMAIAATLTLVFCMGYLATCFKFLSESVFVFMLVLAVYLIRRFILTKNHNFLASAFGIILLAALIKPLAVGLIFICAGFFFRHFFKIASNRFSIIGLVALCFIFFQMDSLRKNHGDFTLSYIDAFTYYNYLGDKADCYKNGTPYVQCRGERYEKFVKLSSTEQKKAAKADLMAQIEGNLPNLIKAYLDNLYTNAFSGSSIIDKTAGSGGILQKTMFRISRLQNVTMTLLGVLISIYGLGRFRQTSVLSLFLAFVFGYIWLVSGISGNQGDRFSIIFYPIVLLQLAFADFDFLKKYNPRTS